MAATTVTLGTVTLNGPAGPTETRTLPRFVSDLSADHTRWTYQTTSAAKSHWTLTFGDLTTSQKNALETYFNNTAKGPTLTFAYVHTDGTSYSNCRFVDTELAFSRIDDNTWSVTLRLEVPTVINS